MPKLVVMDSFIMDVTTLQLAQNRTSLKLLLEQILSGQEQWEEIHALVFTKKLHANPLLNYVE